MTESMKQDAILEIIGGLGLQKMVFILFFCLAAVVILKLVYSAAEKIYYSVVAPIIHKKEGCNEHGFKHI